MSTASFLAIAPHGAFDSEALEVIAGTDGTSLVRILLGGRALAVRIPTGVLQQQIAQLPAGKTARKSDALVLFSPLGEPASGVVDLYQPQRDARPHGEVLPAAGQIDVQPAATSAGGDRGQRVTNPAVGRFVHAADVLAAVEQVVVHGAPSVEVSRGVGASAVEAKDTVGDRPVAVEAPSGSTATGTSHTKPPLPGPPDEASGVTSTEPAPSPAAAAAAASRVTPGDLAHRAARVVRLVGDPTA